MQESTEYDALGNNLVENVRMAEDRVTVGPCQIAVSD